jgi:diadenosine tetraphosphate (Ap4A) HIT family hydrolase
MKIYEDNLIEIAIPEQGACLGHLIITPKGEAKTVDDMPAEVMEHMSYGASYAATVLFETLGAQGTNIIMNEDPVRVEVLARKQDDGLDLLWTPKQLEQADMESAESKIKDNTFMIGKEEEAPTPKSEGPTQEEALAETPATPKDSVEDHEAKENYLIRQLLRVP